jgi:immunoglobulin-binding protein 1
MKYQVYDACLQMKMRESENAQRQAAEQQRLADMGKDMVEEEQLQAQRQMDDWKDDHPTGYGNSKLRPCAL